MELTYTLYPASLKAENLLEKTNNTCPTINVCGNM